MHIMERLRDGSCLQAMVKKDLSDCDVSVGQHFQIMLFSREDSKVLETAQEWEMTGRSQVDSAEYQVESPGWVAEEEEDYWDPEDDLGH